MKRIINKPSVCLLGLGYIGLPTAALMAGRGLEVQGVDVNPMVVEIINKGGIHIIEPDLEGLIEFAVRKKLLRAELKPKESDVFMIAVPTPFIKNATQQGIDGENKNSKEQDKSLIPTPDISYVVSAIESIIPLLKEGNLIIIESTSPIKTTEKMKDLIFSKRSDLRKKIYIAYCPERVLPGQMIYELEHNDRIIGGIDDESSERAKVFYSLFVKGNLYKTNARTAEMCKLVENSFRDVNIAFANELSIISDEADISVWECIDLANKHPRVNILKPGPGVGGHCIAVDPWFIVSDFQKEAELIKNARMININKIDWVIEKTKKNIKEFENQKNKKPRVACMGLSYKPDIDDLRESPALQITKRLIADGMDIIPVEPNIDKYEELEIESYQNAFDNADIIIFLVGHSEFKKFTAKEGQIVLDFCGVTQ